MKKKVVVALCGGMVLVLALLIWRKVDSPVAEQISREETAGENEIGTEREKNLSSKESGTEDREFSGTGDTGEKASSEQKTEGSKPADTSAEDHQSVGTTASEKSSGGSGDSSEGGNQNVVPSNGSGGSGGNGTGNSDTGNAGDQKPESGSGNFGGSGSTDDGNANGNTSGMIEPGPPEHVHNWVEQTTTVTHEATGHYETRVVKEAWDEPVYETKEENVCNVCGEIIEGDPAYHGKEHALAGEGAGHHTEVTLVQTGIIQHEAETEQIWVEDTPAYTETVGAGTYKCSGCGATK